MLGGAIRRATRPSNEIARVVAEVVVEVAGCGAAGLERLRMERLWVERLWVEWLGLERLGFGVSWDRD